MKWPDTRAVLPWVVLIVTLLILVYGVIYKRELLEPVLSLSWTSVLYLLAIKFAVQIFHGVRLNYLTQMFNLKLSVGEWLALSSMTTVLNVVTPAKLGMVSRAYYLKSRHELNYVSYLKLLLVSNFTFLAINTMLAVVGLTVYSETFSRIYKDWYVALAVLLAITIMIPVMLRRRIQKDRESANQHPSHFLPIAQRYIKSVFRLMSSSHYIFYMGAELALLFVKAFSLFACVKATGGFIDFPLLVAITGILSVATVFNITPGNLGVTEVITVYLLVIVGLSTDIAVSVAVLSRVLSVISQVGIANLYSSYLKPKEVSG